MLRRVKGEEKVVRRMVLKLCAGDIGSCASRPKLAYFLVLSLPLTSYPSHHVKYPLPPFLVACAGEERRGEVVRERKLENVSYP